MRRLLIIVAATALLATPALAATRSEHNFSMSFSKKAPGVSTGISFNTDRFAYVPPVMGQPADRVAKTVFLMHPGTRTDTRAVPRCTKTILEEEGPDGCPSGSKIGSGRAVAITGLSGLDPVVLDLTVYASRTGLLAHLTGLTETTIELAMKANRITAEVPRTCSPGGGPADNCSNGEVVLKILDVKINPRTRAGKALIQTPRTCPKSRKWTNKAIYTYADGDTETQTTTSRCRRK